jgi:hypothetical protein
MSLSKSCPVQISTESKIISSSIRLIDMLWDVSSYNPKKGKLNDSKKPKIELGDDECFDDNNCNRIHNEPMERGWAHPKV